MRGLMADQQLLIGNILKHAARVHGDGEIVTVGRGGVSRRYTYGDAFARILRLSNALIARGLTQGAVVGTLAWNTSRHFEIYYATAIAGAVCHTINPRLPISQIRHLIGHADDKLIFVEPDLLDLVADLIGTPAFPKVVLLAEVDEVVPAHCERYEDIVESNAPLSDWPVFNELTAASLCYTSGTTGRPKGVLYSHRSSVLHAMSTCRTDAWGVSGDDVLCPFVPMFHVNGWGLPFAAPLCGADIVLPGPHLKPEDMYRIVEEQAVTYAFAVPTIWHDLLAHLDSTGGRFSTLRRVLISGSALAPDMMSRFEDKYGVEVLQGWGMTESSPMGMVNRLSRRMKTLPSAKQTELRLRQGRPVFGIEANLLALGGQTSEGTVDIGECAIRGLWVASSYFKGDEETSEAFLADGWFRTGDVASVNEEGFFRIVDRQKDAIKSGGEWISSIDLETAALQYVQVVEAAAVAIPHEKWGERPVLAITVADARRYDEGELRRELATRVQKWAMPDHILVFASLPRSAAGKLLKTEIRVTVRTMLNVG